MTEDRHRAAAREWLGTMGVDEPEAARVDELAALLARVESEAVAKAEERGFRGKWDSPEWDKARTPEELAASFDHQGYADGDAGYLGRNVLYAEARMIQEALRGFAEARSALASQLADAQAQVAALREALGWLYVRGGSPVGVEFYGARDALADTAAAAQAHDERIRAEERKRLLARLKDEAAYRGVPDDDVDGIIRVLSPGGGA